ncbi:MAG: hypothetical protein MUC33_23510 [Desulfobacterales bacterium]|nr:hypothetical protein [Desulfobacterales bacterium]
MVRSIIATTAALVTVAFTAAAVQAAPQLIAVGGHQVCLKAQCPGRSRIVCGCPKSSR